MEKLSKTKEEIEMIVKNLLRPNEVKPLVIVKERVIGLKESLAKLNKKPFLSAEENKAYTEIEKMLNFNQRLEQVLSL